MAEYMSICGRGHASHVTLILHEHVQKVLHSGAETMHTHSARPAAAQLIPDEVAFYLLGLQACFVESLEFGILVWQEIGFYHEGRV